MTSPRNLRGIFAMLLAMGVFISSDSCMKIAMAEVPMFQLVLMRGISSSILCFLLIFAMGHGRTLHKTFDPWLMSRGLCEVFANFGFTVAIMMMPMADVTAIAQTCPLMVLIGARMLWGERIGLTRLLLIGVGISGALLVAQPGSTAASPYAILGFLVAFTAAIRDLITRKVPSDIPAPIVAFTVLLILMFAGGVCMVLFETPVMPQASHILLMMLSGGLIVCGHVCIFIAYKIGPARSVAPFMYSVTVWALLLGLLLFNDIPNLLAIIGMTLVVTAGVLIIVLDGRGKPAPEAVSAQARYRAPLRKALG